MIKLEAPTTMSRDRYLDLIRFLGFNPNDVKSIHFWPSHIEVVITAKSDQGRALLIRDQDRIAVHTMEIPIVDERGARHSAWTGLPH